MKPFLQQRVAGLGIPASIFADDNDDISTLLNVTSHHPILTFTECLQAEFEEKRG